MLYILLYYSLSIGDIMCTPPLSAGGWGGGGSLQPFRGGWWERGGGGGVTFSRGGGRNIYIKNKLKYEILYSMAKTFFCVITKNSNWEMLTKNSVAFKR